MTATLIEPSLRQQLLTLVRPRLVETPSHPLIASVEILPPQMPGEDRPKVLDADGNPVEYLSGSRINTFRRCGALYFFKYEQGERERINSALVKGSAFHAGAQVIMFRKMLARMDDPTAPFNEMRYLEEATAAANELIDTEIAKNPDMEWKTRWARGPEETPDSLREGVQYALEAACATVFEQIDPIAVEQGYLIRWKDERVLPMLGYTDVVSRYPESVSGVVDFKTGSLSKEPIELALDIAITGYAASHELTTHIPTSKVAYFSYAFQKEPKFEIIEGRRTYADLERLFSVCKVVTKAKAAGFFIPADDKMKCQSCSFFDKCRALYAPSLAPTTAE